MESGTGFDSLSGEERPHCIEIQPSKVTSSTSTQVASPVQVASPGQTPPLTPPSQSVSFELRQISTYQDLYSFLGVSASITARGGIWNASAEASYVQEHAISSLSNFLAVRVEVRNTSTQAAPKGLSSYGAKYAVNPQEFLRRCGDSFVSSIDFGGEFVAIMEFKSDSETSKKSVSASISAAVGVFTGVNAKAAFASKFSSISGYSEKHYKVVRKGPVASIPDADMEKLIEYALKYPEFVAAASYPYEARLRSYSAIQGAPIIPSAIIKSNKIKLERASGLSLDARIKLADIDIVLTNPHRFVFSPKKRADALAELASARQNLLVFVQQMDLAIVACLDPNVACIAVTQLMPIVVIPTWITQIGGCIAFDDNNKCIECVWNSRQADPNLVRISSGHRGFDETCQGMTADTPVAVTAQGTVDKDAPGLLWMNLFLEVNQACGEESCHIERAYSDRHYVSLSKSSLASHSGSVDVRLFADRCTAHIDKCNLIFVDDFTIRVRSKAIDQSLLGH